jgi:hypothetical protein
MQNFNEYNQLEFEKKFSKSDLYEVLKKEYNLLDFSKSWRADQFGTPRQEWACPTKKSVFSVVPFYYLEFLTNQHPKKIYDLGCGWNIFKKYIPNIIGIGGELPSNKYFFADEHGIIDDDFVQNHQSYFESVFSINALHFIPLSDLKKCLERFYSMIAPNGTGWISLNVQRMIERDRLKFGSKDHLYLDSYIRDELADLDIKFQVVDIDLGILNEYMNGNIRLVMHKAE